MPRSPREPRDRLPFWVHQAVEYGAGFLVATQALGATKPAVPVVAGLALVVLAATADGPLGLFRWIPRRVHHVLDWFAGAGLLALGVLGTQWTSDFGRIFTGLAGAILLVLAWRTDYRTKPTRAQRREAASGPPAASTAPAAGGGSTPSEGRPGTASSPPSPAGASPEPPSGLETFGRRLGRAVGKGVSSYRQPDPSDPPGKS